MKRTAMQDLKAKTIADLEKEVADARAQLFQNRMSRVVEGQGLGMKARAVRRHIARCLTIIGQKREAGAKA